MDDEFGLRYLVVHGHQRAYRMAGSGPALLLLHGLGCNSDSWLPVLPALAERFTVIAPDLLGHGGSDRPRADYSLGGFANGMRDLLTLLGIDRVTVVGHSLGGGVAMQFCYQFPERTERLCLVAPGGLGPEVSFALRALTLPGAGAVLQLGSMFPIRQVVTAGLRTLSRLPLRATRDLDEVAGVFELLCDREGRFAMRHVTSSVIDWHGQIVTMTDRAYLTRLMPMCVVWGADDLVLPVAHAAIAEKYAPGAEVHVLEHSGHFPHKDHPEQFVSIVTAFVRSTKPATYHRGRWRALMRRGDLTEHGDLRSVPESGVEGNSGTA